MAGIHFAAVVVVLEAVVCTPGVAAGKRCSSVLPVVGRQSAVVVGAPAAVSAALFFGEELLLETGRRKLLPGIVKKYRA